MSDLSTSPSTAVSAASAPAWRRPAGVVAYLVVLALVPLVADPYTLGLAATVGIDALLAMGLVLVTGFGGQFSLAQAAFFGLGAYGSGLLTANAGWPPVAALVVSAAFTVGLAYLLGRPIFRLRGHFLAMATLALTQIFSLVVNNLGLTGGATGFGGIPPFGIGSLVFDGLESQFLLVWGIVGLALWSVLRIRRSRDGRALRAVRAHEAAAAASGVDVGWAKTRVFAGSAFLGSVAGSVFAHQLLYLNPAPFDVLRSIDILSIAVIGGLASPWGAVAGAIVMTLLRNGIETALPAVFGAGSVGPAETLVLGIVLVLVLVIWPSGIVGGVSVLWHGIRARRRPTVDETPPLAPPAPPPTERRPIGPAVVEARGLVKDFGGVRAVDGVDLVAHAGEVLAVIGPNGAGKSTLLNLVSGNLRPTSGTVSLGGTAVTGRAAHVFARHGMARSFQTPSLFGDMSVRETVMVGAHLVGRTGMLQAALPTPSAVREEHRMGESADRALAEIGLASLAEQRVDTLSLGRQKLVEVARALAREPSVLLLDEPGAGLNGSEKAELAATLLQLRERGLAIVVIEHDMDFVMSVADRVQVIHFGATLRVGTPAEVQDDPAVVEAYLGASPTRKAAR
ncbi:ABC transporter permease subunit [Pseudonocardia sp. RS010]|uniref:branched-chain amino acid ABC transporter ATP-binding protein/permease n=1 Tax=Pseudonocardia sp. RS010 TaxID=3385979 RepID=UPI0039A0B1C0